MNVISINYNSLKTIPKRIVVLEYLKYFKRKMDDIDDSKSNHKYNFNKKVMLIKYFDILNRSIVRCVNNIMKAYDTIIIIFKSRYPTATFPTL